jgi:hypothetical protein
MSWHNAGHRDFTTQHLNFLTSLHKPEQCGKIMLCLSNCGSPHDAQDALRFDFGQTTEVGFFDH